MRRILLLGLLASAGSPAPFAPTLFAGDGNRLAYLDELNPWHPSLRFPKLVTPQWVGEEGVECVVTLAIDDMRDPAKYEAYLRPILNRLKQIDGRAPVSIMTCNVQPDDPQLQAWLDEGLSLECHTVDHPCPLLAGGDFAKAKSTYDRCVDLLASVPRNKPVAFRMPCCDSLNTVSPRFYAEVFNRTTEKGNFLQLDSSVFTLYTADDPEIPRELIFDATGRERFRKYVPKGVKRGDAVFNTFVNLVENYPYPYLIGNQCWEFPCMVPSDWCAQHLHKPNNPQTVDDWKAALDITVKKQGVFNLVFHPHNWIRPEQVVELIDHAVEKHGRKVKFLNFRECVERLNANLRLGDGLAGRKRSAGVHLLDVDLDGRMDLVRSASTSVWRTIWNHQDRAWRDDAFPGILANAFPGLLPDARFAVLEPDGRPSALTLVSVKSNPAAELLAPLGQKKGLFHGAVPPVDAPPLDLKKRNWSIRDVAFQFRDLDGDGRCEYLVGTDVDFAAWQINADSKWEKLPFGLPEGVPFARQGDGGAGESGLRLIDLDEDGRLDLVFSNHERYGVWLFDSMQAGWTRVAMHGKRGEKRPEDELPPFVRADGTDNGFFVHNRALYWQNEDTDKLPDLVDRRPFNDLFKDVEPRAKSPEAALKSMRPRSGFVVELMAAEPLVMDPVAFEWGADGKLWVAEMADYPLGIDGADTHGGRVRFLEDTDGDGRYDKSSLFLEGVAFPTGVLPWKNGVLVTSAPDIFFAEDLDGDGRADKRVALFTGFAEGNQQHRVNGLVRGLDGWIYCANGDSGGTVKSLQTGETLDIRGRDLRINPETGAMEAIAGQSQFGRNRDDFGNWFGGNNSRPMWHFVLDEHYQKRNPHFASPDPRVDVSVAPGAAPVFPTSRTLPRFNNPQSVNRFTSACSAMIYRDDLFGPAFAGNMFVSEPVHNLVHREVMTPSGVTFTSRRADDEEETEFLTSTDNWFRPTMIRTGPDGALWIADMYRQTIEHPEWIPKDWQKRLDLRAGHDKGRIYRVYPVERPPRPMPRLDRIAVNAMTIPLDSRSGWELDTIAELIVERRVTDLNGLQKIARSSKEPAGRVQALCVLDRLGLLTWSAVIDALTDEHPGVRKNAVRLCERDGQIEPRQTANDPETARIRRRALDGLYRLANDADPQVQMQVAWTLGELHDAGAASALADLGARADDRYLFAAVMSSLNARNIEAVLARLLSAPPTEGSNRFLVEALRTASALNPTAARDALSSILGPFVKSGGRGEAAFRTAARGVAAFNRPGALAEMRASKDIDARLFVKHVDLVFETARRHLQEASVSEGTRLAAISILGRSGTPRDADDRRLLATLLEPRESPAVRSAAIDALVALRGGDTPAVLLSGWRAYGPATRGQALDALLNRPEWRAALLDGVEGKALSPNDFDASRRQRLLSGLTAQDRARAETLLAAEVAADRRNVVEGYRPALSLDGDVERGARLFAKTCANCHRLRGTGYEVGPDLGSVKDKSPEALLVAILDPNRAVESRYLNYVATLSDGSSATGILATETATSLTLRGPEAKERTVLRSELDELAGTAKSLMPEGMEKDLSPQDAADVIAFVRASAP